MLEEVLDGEALVAFAIKRLHLLRPIDRNPLARRLAEPPVKKPRLALLVVAVPPAPERPLAHSQKLGGLPWLSSADSHRCKTFKNIAMRTP